MDKNIIEEIRRLCYAHERTAGERLVKIRNLIEDADYPDFSTIKDGEQFEYRGHEWVRLGRESGGILCVDTDSSEDVFNPNGSNDWRKSPIRKALNTEFIKDFNKDKLISYTSDLVADNGDDRYGKCEDKVFILSYDLIRKYRKVLPKWKNWIWTLTPWYINDSGIGYGVRVFDPSSALSHGFASNTCGVAPACIFKENK